MLRNYLKTALRSLINHKIYSAINILGLTAGVTAVILILLYIRHELSFDNFHVNGDRLYRLSIITQRGEITEEDSYMFTPPIGPAMKQEFPEVENYMRFSTARNMYCFNNNQAHKIEALRYADSTLFDLFSFELLSGDPSTALSAPHQIILSQSLASRIFNHKNPIGEVITLDDKQGYEVTGIIADQPVNTHLQFDALISFNSLFENPEAFLGWNGGNQYITYVKLKENTKPETVKAKFPGFMWRNINEDYADYGIELQPYLQPLRDIHLHYNPYSKNLRANLKVFGLVGLLILFIACVNFINLTTARASWRAKEIGVRKVLGAGRIDLIRQFLGESFVITTISFLLALILVTQLTPLYGALLGKQLSVSTFFDWTTVGMLLLLLLVVSLIAGSYPAFYLSSLDILKTIKGLFSNGRRSKEFFRNGLIVFQFAISTALIISTLVISWQIHFLQNKELGFDKDQVLILPLKGDAPQLNTLNLKQELLKLAQVKEVSSSSEIPGHGFTSNGYIPEGQEQPVTINVVDVDESFLETYNLKLLGGRFFNSNRPMDHSGYLVNESFVKMMNWIEPLGKTINRNGDHRVIGVVQDFHFAPLHSKIKPLILTNQAWQERFHFMTVKLHSGPLDVAVASVQGTWQKVLPHTPLNFWFLDESIDQIYWTEIRFRKMFLYFSILSILIASMGIWGLATLSIRQRTKEVGIRKVLGATITQLIGLLSKEFLLLLTVALTLAFPIAWFSMNNWLSSFPYRVGMSWWIFLVSGLLVLLIAFLTVATRAIQTAKANPIEALRSE